MTKNVTSKELSMTYYRRVRPGDSSIYVYDYPEVTSYTYSASNITNSIFNTVNIAESRNYYTSPYTSPELSGTTMMTSDSNYYAMRYYSTDLGRWINRDPIGEKGGMNVYAFVDNDGVNKWDLVGLKCCGNKKYNQLTQCCCSATKKISNKPYSAYGTVWKGSCVSSSMGFWVSGTQVNCSLKSEITSECKKWDVTVQSFMVGVTTGVDFSAVTFNAVFDNAEKPSDFQGESHLSSVGSVFMRGVVVSSLNLGKEQQAG